MKSSNREKSQAKTTSAQAQASAGPEGVAIMPPPSGIDFVDRRLDEAQSLPASKAEGEVIQRIHHKHFSSRKMSTSPRTATTTGLPDKLKTGVEHLSGLSMDDVKVHYNSTKPAQLQASAYAKGTDIHLGPRQQKHLPHETWHVVQQKQGRVKPTMQMQGVGMNDDVGLEQEADVMGAKALHEINSLKNSPATVAQRMYQTKTPLETIQKKKGDPKKLAEAEYAKVSKGESITWTALAAGCIAIALFFDDGGGVGYHLAMKEDNVEQWKELKGQVEGKSIKKVKLHSDMIGQKQGWFVRVNWDDDFMAVPDITSGPRSALVLEEMRLSAEDRKNWIFQQAMVTEWFQKAFGVKTLTVDKKTKEVTETF